MTRNRTVRPLHGLRAACVAVLVLAASPSRAQEAQVPAQQPQAQQPQAQQPQQPPRLSGPESGFIGALGRFIERSIGPVAPSDAPKETKDAAIVEIAPPAAPAPPDVAAPPSSPPPAARPADPFEVPRGIAKGAIDAVTRLPSTVGLPQVGLPSSVVTGRERCVVAGNGAPDCLAATEALCKSKGFSAGNSLDIQSAQRCKAHVWLSGRAEASDCTTESFVTRAMCR